jgi:hypothetical protein
MTNIYALLVFPLPIIGATSLQAIADGLNARSIPAPSRRRMEAHADRASVAPCDQPPLLLSVRDAESPDRLLDRGPLVRCVDESEESTALADERDLPRVDCLRLCGSLCGHHSSRECCGALSSANNRTRPVCTQAATSGTQGACARTD